MTTKLVSMDQIKFKELATAIKALNTSAPVENGIIQKIATVGKSKEELVRMFLDAVQTIPDDPETGEWAGPDAAGDYYNKIMVEQPDEPAPTTGAEKPVKEKKEKEPKEKKEKVFKKSGVTRVTQLVCTNPKISKEEILKVLAEEGFSVSSGTVDMQMRDAMKVIVALIELEKLPKNFME